MKFSDDRMQLREVDSADFLAPLLYLRCFQLFDKVYIFKELQMKFSLFYALQCYDPDVLTRGKGWFLGDIGDVTDIQFDTNGTEIKKYFSNNYMKTGLD